MAESAHKVQFAATLRGVAALAVVISHYCGMFWTSQGVIENLIFAPPLDVSMPVYLGWLHRLPQFNWGAFGVALFFLISGFVIPFSFVKATWLSFLVGRFFRIFPLYAVGFSISLLGIWITVNHYGRAWPFSLPEVMVHYLPGLRELLWSRSIDGIIWTLDIEVKFYVVCACVAVALRIRSAWAFVAPALVALTAFYLLSRIEVWQSPAPWAARIATGLAHPAPYIIFMFIGVVFHYLHWKALKPELAVTLIAGLFLLHLTVVQSGMFRANVALAWSYGGAVVFFGFAASFPALFKERPITKFLADISFPLYAVHAVSGYVALHFLTAAGWPAWLSLIATTGGAVGLAWGLHISIEGPSHKLGRHLTRRRVQAAPAAA